MKKQINYQQEVKKIYPDAKCIGAGATLRNKDLGVCAYMIIGAKTGMNYSYTKFDAWECAYKNLVEQGKIKPQQ